MFTFDNEEVTFDSEYWRFDIVGIFDCIEPGALVEQELDKIATQYREAAKFLSLVRAYLGETEAAARAACLIPQYFDIDSAGGDQLTIIGKWLGFQRCHCVCDVPDVVGYDCGGSYTGPFNLVGYCAPGSTWLDCPPLGSSTLCLDDDETFRGFAKARRYQMLGLYDLASLQAAARHIWGSTASVIDSRVGQVTIAPGRALTADETAQLPIAFRVLPVAPGIRGRVHLGTGPIAGYGAGWSGYCESAEWLCPADPHTYTCT
ncbi:DUF2612 domain-containing protein [Bosea sp. (in: a-proteobacteria)]|uniref:DUF2612 domain-containing protein n=1 Tax=Bosea sp. (in: a-proteobacteria) TaxID=1871050 RepID=UPI0026299309|nr:DUF2612 domain-containing protein [Bosea sp. (in: a-proteobacteria)]MCO5092070.1 DUF2612 domain-containing protein [Bosea sp. (in: a-proteobacteria)]